MRMYEPYNCVRSTKARPLLNPRAKRDKRNATQTMSLCILSRSHVHKCSSYKITYSEIKRPVAVGCLGRVSSVIHSQLLPLVDQRYGNPLGGDVRIRRMWYNFVILDLPGCVRTLSCYVRMALSFFCLGTILFKSFEYVVTSNSDPIRQAVFQNCLSWFTKRVCRNFPADLG